MNSKIIFWMNDHLALLGLPKILQEKYNFDIFSVFDVSDKKKNFFEKQELIKFSKIWFFHDHIHKTNQKPDREFLKSIEEKYKVDLGLLTSNERFFMKFNQFYKFSPDEILLILEQECRLFEKILDEVNPDFLIIGYTTLHYNHLFYKICQARGVKILTDREMYLRGLFLIASRSYLIDSTEYDKKHNFDSFSEIQNYIKKYDATTDTISYSTAFQSSKKKYLQSAIKYLFSDNSNVKTHFTYYGRSKFAVIRKMLSYELRKKYRKNFINKNLIRKIENGKPFIYFSLHTQQERSTLIHAPLFVNQTQVIAKIADSLPNGYNLYVKEHPNMLTRGWREISDYKEIMNLPNVTLIHPFAKSLDIIKKSSLVISIGGTSPLEAAFYNKPSIILSNQDYSHLPSVHQVETLDEIPNAIQISLKKKVNVSDLNNYLNLVESNSFKIDLSSLSDDFDRIFHYSGFYADVEIPIDKMENFIKKHWNLYEKLSAEFVKKIQNDA